ncbi:MAG TPA: RnfH family protein [Noviherbaspirillum sp.]|uniref:RnfH family protein n=1 Tax=Noviherbaspirillum sp. TaxID=1926288 RepID=UPI002B49ED00|nr:RnfH family protein [Noviherbaspirillum sp.]HJV87133.1 RnfH family protein [Noviherbaspirillum sp.]
MADIRVQVCYARPEAQTLRDVVVPEGATLQSAIEHSGVLHDWPEIDLSRLRVGVYGKLKALDTLLRDRDRIEIYRPLIADPKESRRKRAVKKEEAKGR